MRALAFVGIQLYRSDRLRHILAPQFHLPVLIGSISVLVLVAVRAVSVWREAGELQPLNDMSCQENHIHSAACDHLPGMPGGANPDANLVDDHGHSHDMSWMFARMLVLVFPVALFALGMPNSSFSKEGQLGESGTTRLSTSTPRRSRRWRKTRRPPFSRGRRRSPMARRSASYRPRMG